MIGTCPHCGSSVVEGARFCNQCGGSLWAGCRSCGAEMNPGARFCSMCGTPVEEASPAARVEERRVISVLFADLAGFTAHTERSDPEDVRARLTVYHRKLREDVERHGGRIEKLIGDGVFAVFGAPTAHEDDPERAVRAALRAQISVEELNVERADLALAVRIAVTTGEAVVQVDGGVPDREGIVGDVVNTASRLQAIAAPGGVVVDQRTYHASRGTIDYEPLDPVNLKGKSEPVAVWRALSARSRLGVAVGDDDATRFVGRSRELALLLDAFERAVDESSAQLVTLTGEPGVGKSRLLHELFQTLDARPDIVWWRQGRCLPYGEGITFFALGEVVKAQAGILEAERPTDARVKLRIAVNELIPDAEEAEWVARTLEPLVGSGSFGAQFDELVAGWRRFIGALATRSPLVMVIEDLHWADQALMDFLDDIPDWAFDLPILLVCTARPELYARHPGWAGGIRNAVTIALAPLGEEDTESLLEELLPPEFLTSVRRRELIERSGGNPLYAIEYARLVTETGGNLQPPDSVQALIAARLDLLEPDVRLIAQAASVVGRVFWTKAIGFMLAVPLERVLVAMKELTSRELVRPVRSPSMSGQDEWNFRHALVRDVAYGQLARADRARLHEQVGRWLEAVSADNPSETAAIIAHHYFQALSIARSAGQDRPDLATLARRFAITAAERAGSLDAQAAIELYRRAIELTEPGEERGRILYALSHLEADSGALDAAEKSILEAVALLERAGPQEMLGMALGQAGRIAWLRGDGDQSRRLRSQALSVVDGLSASQEVALALQAAGAQEFLAGNSDVAIDLAERALAMVQQLGDVESVLPIKRLLGSALSYGRKDPEGGEILRDVLSMAADRGQTREVIYTANNLHAFVQLVEGSDAALAVIEPAIDLASQRGYQASAEFSRTTRVESLMALGRWDESWDEAIEVGQRDEERGGSQIGVMAATHLIMLDHFRGRPQEALTRLEPSLRLARDIHDPQVLMPVLALSVPVMFGAGRLDNARLLAAEFEEVPDGEARDHHSYWLILQADELVSLGELERLERITEALDTRLPFGSAMASAMTGFVEQARDGHSVAAPALAVGAAGFESLRHLVFANWCRIFEARSRAALGETAAAEGLLASAREFFEPRGGAYFLDKIAAMRRG